MFEPSKSKATGLSQGRWRLAEMNASTLRARPLVRASLLLAALLGFTACRTVQPTSVVSWREAVQAAKEQSRVTFEAVGLLVRESKLDRIERLPPSVLPKIAESDVES